MTVDFASSDSLASVSEFVLKLVLTNEASQTNAASSQTRKVQLREIFDSDHDRKPSYAKLEERICFFLGLDVYKMFLTLTYRDEENDCIHVSSSVELEYAIQQFSNHSSTMTLEGVATATAEAIEIRKLKEQLARQREEAEQNKKDMKNQVNNLRDQLDSKHQEVEHEQAVNAFKKEEAEQNLKDMKEQVDNLREQLDIKHQEVEQVVNAFRKEQDEHEKRKKEVDDLRNQLDSKDQDIEQAVDALKKEQDGYKKTKKEVDDLRQELNNIMKEQDEHENKTKKALAAANRITSTVPSYVRRLGHVEYPKIRFDISRATGDLSIGCEGRTVTHNVYNSSYKCACATMGFSSGCHYWSFQVPNRAKYYGYIWIGVSGVNETSLPGSGMDPTGCSLDLGNGNFYHSGTAFKASDTSLVTKATKIGILLDMNNKTVSFYADGKFVGTGAGLDVLIESVYYPVVGLWDVGDCVMIEDIVETD